MIKARALWTTNISQMKMKATDIKNKQEEKEKRVQELETYYKKQTTKRQQEFKMD